MSFPKAKIHRFNEETSCAPPPGTYDPKIDTKVKGAIVAKSKRFPNQMCNSSSLDNLEKSNNSQVTFRTPQLMRKVITLTPRLKYLQEKKFDTPGSGSSNASITSEEKLPLAFGQKKNITRADYQRLENELSALADKHLCELLEKNLEISKLKGDLEEIKTHEAELKLILEEKSALALERSKELKEVKNYLDIFDEKITKEREDHQSYIDELKQEISILQAKKEDLEGILTEKQCAIVIINDKYLDLENQLAALLEENEQIKKSNSDILDKISTESEQKLENFEQGLKLKVHNLEEDFNTKQEKVQVDFQTKLNFVSHEFDLKTHEIQNQMESCVLRLKEIEKIVDQKAKDFSKSIQEADERCKYLYRELCKVEEQRDDLVQSDLEKKLYITEIQVKCNCFENDLKQCRSKCKNYEITLNTMQNTIKALSDRLVDSESEVERLSNVEVDLETQKKLLEEKSQLLLSDISALRDSMDKMEKDIIFDVTVMKDHLASKVEIFKAEAAKEIGMLNDKIYEKQCAIEMLLNDNSYYKKELERKESYISDLTHKVKELKDDIVHLREDCSKAEVDFSEKISAQKNLCKILNDKLENATGIIDKLQMLKLNNENQISILMEKTEKYEVAAVNAEREIGCLKDMNLKQLDEMNVLKSEIQKAQQVIVKSNENEIKQQQYIDELISDLVLEKERCVSLESEKEEIKAFLCKAKKNNDENSQQIKDLNLKIETLERSLRNAEEKITVIDEAKATIEIQLIESENNNLELKNIRSKSEDEWKSKNNELQSMLSLAKERIKTEIPNLEHDNINKAQCILELSMTNDNLKEKIGNLETNLSCLKAEKANLNLQLEDARNNISNLQSVIDDKNLIINNLTNQISIESSKYKDYLSQIDQLSSHLKNQTETLKLNAVANIKLSEAEETIAELKKRLSEVDLEKREKSEAENKKLREELEISKLMLQRVTEERDKIDHELAELMGHQNIHQKIKHVNQLKQLNHELIEKYDRLEIENTMLKKKLAEFKENANMPQLEINTPKTLPSTSSITGQKLKAKKKLPSPAVLRDRNH